MNDCVSLFNKEGIKFKSKEEFDKKFRLWSLKNHPDKGGDTEKFQTMSDCRDKIKTTGIIPRFSQSVSPKNNQQKNSTKSSSVKPYSTKQAECLRKVLNNSKLIFKDMFYKKNEFDINNLDITSPKLKELFEKIKKLDADDMKESGKLFKHFIFTDVKTIYGLRMIATAMLKSGDYNLVMKPVVVRTGPKKLSRRKVIVDKQIIESGKKAGKTNFVFLSSVAINEYNYATAEIKKDLLSPKGIFNNRSTNLHGEDVRIIILDSGFKEGIDLLDIKYCHIFDTFNTSADKEQAIGRALRYCGQSGLSFEQNKGWELKIFMYKTLSGDKDLGQMYWDIKSPKREELTLKRDNLIRIFQESSLNAGLN